MNTAAKPRTYTLQSALSEVEEVVARAYAPRLDPAVRDTLRASIYLWMGDLSDPPTSVRVGEVSVRWVGPGNTTQGVSWLAREAPGVVLWAERAILYRLIADEDQDLADVRLAEGIASLPRKGPHPAVTHCDNCGCDWLDNGLNPIGCPYYELSAKTEALRAEVDRLSEALRGWWKAHRPVGWTEDQHRSCPHVNLATDAEKALADAALSKENSND